MADTTAAASGAAPATTTTAPASQPASSSPAPSAPAAPGADSAGAAPSAPQKRQTAEDIFAEALGETSPAAPGSEPEGDAPKELTQNTDTQKADDEKAAAKDAKTAKDDQGEEIPDSEVPEHYRGVFKAHPELRGAYYRDAVITKELKMTVKEARELRAMHGNLASAREGHQDALALRTIADEYGVAPERTAEFLKSVNPQSFEKLKTTVLSEELADPAAFYAKQPEMVRPLVDLAAERIVRALAAEEDDDSRFVAKFLWERLQRSRATVAAKKQEPKPEAPPEVMRELETLRAEKSARTGKEQATYTKLVVDQSKQLINKKFLGHISKHDPNGIFSEEDRADMARECYAELDSRLGAKEGANEYRAELRRLLAGNDSAAVLEFLDRHASVEAQDIASKITAKWRKRSLGANERLLKQLDQKAGIKSEVVPQAQKTNPNRPLTKDERAEEIFRESGVQ